MSSEKLDKFKDEKYLCLKTYKKNGHGVETPMWFVISDGSIYIATDVASGKVKRLKNNKSVQIALSDFKGRPKSEWIEGVAFFGNESELNQTMLLRNKKYGILSKISNLFLFKKVKIISIGIKI